MDMITESLLDEFSKEQEITSLDKDRRFEHFAAYIAVRRQYGETFNPSDVVTGKGGDTGIDAVAIIVNGTLITDLAALADIGASASLDVTFVFIQAQQTPSFDTAKLGQFGFGLMDFFNTGKPKLDRNDRIQSAVALMRAIYKRSSKFHRGKPQCKVYFITTGRLEDDKNLRGRKEAVESDLFGLNLFSSVDLYLEGAEGIEKMYRLAKNAITRQFEFNKRTVVPSIAGIKEAYLGLLPASEVLNILRDEDGEITKSIFYDNVRDWQGNTEVNGEIRNTLLSETSARFALMNNGVTIIARHLQATGDMFLIEDFQVVNGCQTSHVLFEVARDAEISPSVMVPVRLIATQDEEVINSIIRATNRQTQVKDEQFFALTEFPKQLESFFASFPEGRRLYYERRSRQYDSLTIEKTRIVTQTNLVRAFAAMFLNEPHTVTRSYKSIRIRIGRDIYGKNNKPHPYYTAALALYKLEYLFRNHKVDASLKPARFHILYAIRLLANTPNMPQMNSRAMEAYCEKIRHSLWNNGKAEALLAAAIDAVKTAAAPTGVVNRDAIRATVFTDRVAKACGYVRPGPPA